METVVAFSVLLLVLLAVAGLTGGVLGQAATARAQSAAGGLAESVLGGLAHQPLSTLDAEVDQVVPLPPVTLAGETFARQQYLTWQAGNGPNLCQSGQPPVALQATVTVSWNHDRQHLSESSVVDPPYSPAEAGQGDLAVQIQSAQNPSEPPTQVQAIAVVVQNAQGQTVTTATPDSAGCVYLALPAGSYTVSVQSPQSPLFVDPSGQAATPPGQVSVEAGQVTQLAVPFDQAAPTTFAPAAASPPPVPGLPVTVTASGLPSGAQVVVAAGSTSEGPAPLFPFPSGYQAFFGDCSAEAPASPTGFPTSPGTDQTVDLAGLVPLDLAVSAKGAGPVSGTLTLAPPSGSGCPADQFPLGPSSLHQGAGQLDRQVLAFPATLTLVDQADGASTTVQLAWDASTEQWLVTQGGTTTPYQAGQPIPVAVG
ncbi:carboxypeptidase-like regulatory domain-containing protein [Aciditerrimonas ferrireducens]|uniref:Carboxypeptidase-like regulatory domain-containing protein n=1 Tax=Aciditerrimonas ferrireducens TaxID=667306 RepID=A0ABV6C2I3_9ACTN|nr:carboxypeptidase-like regulatory domain-containing protein [Aciditerrimonas ferrireducens]MCK4177454.1 carboxypeptidase-like regulatory domain-containing protein [Aciditerrimonas ferrireducens]